MKSLKEHITNGTYRPSRHSKRAKWNSLTKVPRAPQELNTGASAHWKKVCGDLSKLGILFESDLQAVARLCYLYNVQDSLQKSMDKLTANSELYLQSIREYDRVSKLLLPLESALGLNAMSRRKIDTKDDDLPGGLLK